MTKSAVSGLNVFVYTPFAVAPAEARRALIALHRIEFFQAWLRYLGWPRKRKV